MADSAGCATRWRHKYCEEFGCAQATAPRRRRQRGRIARHPPGRCFVHWITLIQESAEDSSACGRCPEKRISTMRLLFLVEARAIDDERWGDFSGIVAASGEVSSSDSTSVVLLLWPSRLVALALAAAFAAGSLRRCCLRRDGAALDRLVATVPIRQAFDALMRKSVFASIANARTGLEAAANVRAFAVCGVSSA